MERQLRVLIADDQPRARGGLRALLNAAGVDVPGCPVTIEVVAEAVNGLEAVRMAEECRPDVVVMDVRMPELDGIHATRAIKERHPEIKVVVLTMYDSHQAEAFAAGADAFLLKGCGEEELLGAVMG